MCNEDRSQDLLEDAPVVSANLMAGVILCARQLATPLGLTMPSATEVLAASGARKSRAYELRGELNALLPTLLRPVGRPPAERATAAPSVLLSIRGDALRFVMTHPGCIRRGERGRYSDAWRRFVVTLRDRHPDLPLPDLAEALCLPLGTLQDWLPVPSHPLAAPQEADVEADAEVESPDDQREARRGQIETVLEAWRQWHGSFTAFCEHVRRDRRLDFGNTLIAGILRAHGERIPTPRPGRSRDDEALRGAFETFFPGAQWVADGKALDVVVDDQPFTFNLELHVDAATGAAVGIDVRDEEDSAALIAAFDDGVQTTGEAPLAVLVDNRPSNHTPEVDAALDPAMRIDSTPNRPQNKAHVEGAFGLFSQKAPPVEVDTTDPYALARALAALITTTFFRAFNRAPRRDRQNLSRVELYAEHVSDEDREAARKSLRERLRKQQLAQQTRAARVDPTLRALLDDAFERLDLLDPERRLRNAIACYPPDAIVDAIAIFEAKQQRGTLPPGVDARYLLGIAQNLHHLHEADDITIALLRERIAARDRFLAPLQNDRDHLLALPDASSILDHLVDRLVDADRQLDRHFWLDALTIEAPIPDDDRRTFARRAAARIHACFRLPPRERHRLVRLLLRRLWPLG